MTVMSIQPGEDIGLEVHQKGDQFIRVEEGTARVQMGKSKTNLSYDKTVGDDWAMFIPEGYWHNISNAGMKSSRCMCFMPRQSIPQEQSTQPRPVSLRSLESVNTAANGPCFGGAFLSARINR